MNEPLENSLVEAIKAQTQAITRLAESNEGLVAIIYETLLADPENGNPSQTYLSGKPRG